MTSNSFEPAAEFIRTHLDVDDVPGRFDHLRFGEALVRHRKRKAKIRTTIAASTVLVGTVAIALGLASSQVRGADPLSFQIGNNHLEGSVGSYVSAPRERSVDLHFSEGSEVILRPSSRGRVAETTSKGATVVLEDGHARADIVHRDGTDWRVFAGPYVVGVTGTSFEVGFNASTQTFELEMRSGSVRVTGPGIKSPIEIRDQQRITLSTAARTPPEVPALPAEDAALSAPDPGSSAASGSVACPASNAPPPEARPVLSGSSHATKPAIAESYSQLGDRGEHARIVELAEQDGVEGVTSQASAKELLALGNAARFVGKPQIATKAYRALRDRFGNTPNATSAAFFLGRLTESSSPTAAIQWYEKYMAEAPNGIWMPDALGRRLVLIHQVQGKQAALGPAREYLERFASGPYAGFARKLLSL